MLSPTSRQLQKLGSLAKHGDIKETFDFVKAGGGLARAYCISIVGMGWRAGHVHGIHSPIVTPTPTETVFCVAMSRSGPAPVLPRP